MPETKTHSCDRWALSTVDKLPPEVAAVRVDLGDGSSATVPTGHGSYDLNLLRPLPPGGRNQRESGGPAGFVWGRQITCLGAGGSVLAAARLDNPHDPEVPGLPPLRAYGSIGVPWEP